METARLVLDYIRVFLSPQVAAAVIVIVFAQMFRKEFVALIGRIGRFQVRLPGGGEISASQTEPPPARNNEPPPVPPEQALLPGITDLASGQSKHLEETVRVERARAYLWEYRYLNYYLVPNTQRVLVWLASLQDRASYLLFNDVWMPAVPDPDERNAILNALRTHHLVQMENGRIEVTPKGREYITWRGSPPTQPT